VKLGFNFLVANNIPLCTYLNAFLIKSIDDTHNPKKAKEYQDIVIDIESEPEVLELIRLCYWINRCKVTVSNSFNNKFNEVKEQLELGGKDELGTSFAKRRTIISKILLEDTIPRRERTLHKTCFLNELNKFRFIVSSVVSEFMFAAFMF
jgi:hypothetical protein